MMKNRKKSFRKRTVDEESEEEESILTIPTNTRTKKRAGVTAFNLNKLKKEDTPMDTEFKVQSLMNIDQFLLDFELSKEKALDSKNDSKDIQMVKGTDDQMYNQIPEHLLVKMKPTVEVVEIIKSDIIVEDSSRKLNLSVDKLEMDEMDQVENPTALDELLNKNFKTTVKEFQTEEDLIIIQGFKKRERIL
ncbi:hypothetical protein BC833DRAFT_625512 [Globomyces pollinis-pini]|nr:hypothetical protein BC833DRAFT_625512 [Globomyces pollinis-pini]